MEVQVIVKSVYGHPTIYPVCANGKLFAEIAGTTSLTKPVIALIKSLGYKVVNTTPVLEV